MIQISLRKIGDLLFKNAVYLAISYNFLFAPSFAQEILMLECTFKRITKDSISIHSGTETKKESFAVDTATGAVKDGGIAYLVSRASNTKTNSSDNKFSAIGSGELTKDMSVQYGTYEIDRVTGTYNAKITILAKNFLDDVRVSQVEDIGTCKSAKKQF